MSCIVYGVSPVLLRRLCSKFLKIWFQEFASNQSHEHQWGQLEKACSMSISSLALMFLPWSFNLTACCFLWAALTHCSLRSDLHHVQAGIQLQICQWPVQPSGLVSLRTHLCSVLHLIAYSWCVPMPLLAGRLTLPLGAQITLDPRNVRFCCWCAE